MTEISAALQSGLRDEGLVVCTVGRGAVRGVLSEIGDIVEETWVRQHAGASTYLSGCEAVPLHTDHPEASWVAWWCDVQARRDGANVLADGQMLLDFMGEEEAAALRGIELRVPPQLPRQSLDSASVWDGRRLYYAPWYPVVRTTGRGRRALEMFIALLAMGFGRRRIRLQPGDMLVIDNGRWLHGRDRLEEDNGRSLWRLWMR